MSGKKLYIPTINDVPAYFSGIRLIIGDQISIGTLWPVLEWKRRTRAFRRAEGPTGTIAYGRLPLAETGDFPNSIPDRCSRTSQVTDRPTANPR